MINRSTIQFAGIFCLFSLVLGLLIQYQAKLKKERYTNISPESLLAEEAFHPHKGFFIDPRDGQKYRTVKLFDKIWMAENLNFNTLDKQSFCYDKEGVNCQQLGRLYNWKAAVSACPKGWRLPSDKEWNKLYVRLGNTKEAYNALKKDGYMGFDAEFGGWRAHDLRFRHKGERAYFWSADKAEDVYARYYRLDRSKKLLSSSNAYWEVAFSCRCIKD